MAIRASAAVDEGPDGGVGITLSGELVIGETDLTMAMSVDAGLVPPRVAITGLTVGTSRGLALRDVVSAFAPDVDIRRSPTSA